MASESDGAQRLTGYVDTWRQSISDLVAFLEDLPAQAWSTPEALPGWTVHDVVAHVAHLETVLAGEPHDEMHVEQLPHMRGGLGYYTEQGVVARRVRTPAELLEEIRGAAAVREAELRADPPTDPAAKPPIVFGGMPWGWETLLSNRALDVWMHEQDIRRAVSIPGGLDSPGARHTVGVFLKAFGGVVAKRAQARPGQSAVLVLDGRPATAVEVNDEGRAIRVEAPQTPTIRISTDTATFVALAGGRGEPAAGAVEVEGDQELAGRVLSSLTVTP